MKKHISRSCTSWLWLAAACLFLTACADSSPGQVSQGIAATPSTYVFVQDVPVIYRSFEEIVNWADVIMIGRPVAMNGILNTSRHPDDISQPHPEIFSIGQVYEVEAINYIKGEGPATLYVIQYQGYVSISTQELTDSAIQQAQEQALQAGQFIPLSLSEHYVFFLKDAGMIYVDFPEDHFLGNAHPWRFRIDAADCVYPESEADILRYWPPQTLESFLYDIQNRTEYPEIIPYPYTDSVPVVHGTPCQPALPPAPYP